MQARSADGRDIDEQPGALVAERLKQLERDDAPRPPEMERE
jgi:hypothetical protein